MNVVVFRFINEGLRHPVMDWAMPVFSDKSLIVIPGLALWFFWMAVGGRRVRILLTALLVALAVSDLGSERVLKNLAGAARPYARLAGVHHYHKGEWKRSDAVEYTEKERDSHSFPSSHAANIAALATVLFFVRRKSLWVTGPLVCLVGVSRIYTGNHFPADVVCGYGWGVLCGIGSVAFCRGVARRLWHAAEDDAPVPVMPRERKAFLGVLICWTLLNFAFVHVGVFSLAGDEAHYWDWSRNLALGYYSKPPMIAYLDAMLVSAGGAKEWALRSGAVLLSSGALALVYGLTARIAKNERAALLSVGILLAMPLTWAGAVLMTPDAPLAFFWALALYAFFRAIEGERRMWYLAGLALGLGMLSKYTMAVLGATFVVYLALRDRKHLRRKEPHIAALIALLCMGGVLYWNWANDWVSFRHTAAIGVVEGRPFGERLLNVATFIAGEAGVVSPVLFGMFVWALAQVVRRWRTDSRAVFLFLCSAGLFCFYLVISWSHRPEANWAACAYVAAAPALAWVWTSRPRSKPARCVLAGGMVLGVAIGIAARSTDLVYALGSAPEGRPDRVSLFGLVIDPDKDPTNELRGARELGEAVSKYLGDDTEPFLFSDRYQIAAQLAFYAKGRPTAYCMNPGDRRFNQYDLWGGWTQLVGRDGLFVAGGGLKASTLMARMVECGAFEDGEVLETVEVRRGETVVKRYTICRLRKYSGYEWRQRETKY